MESEKKFLMRCKRLLKQGAHSTIAYSVENRIKKYEKELKKLEDNQKIIKNEN